MVVQIRTMAFRDFADEPLHRKFNSGGGLQGFWHLYQPHRPATEDIVASQTCPLDYPVVYNQSLLPTCPMTQRHSPSISSPQISCRNPGGVDWRTVTLLLVLLALISTLLAFLVEHFQATAEVEERRGSNSFRRLSLWIMDRTTKYVPFAVRCARLTYTFSAHLPSTLTKTPKSSGKNIYRAFSSDVVSSPGVQIPSFGG